MQPGLHNSKAVAVVLIGLVLGCALFWLGRADQREQTRLEHAEYESPPPGMVLVPAGEFLMGSNDPEAEPDERPLRSVFVPAFYIDRFEVTNRQFKEFDKDHPFPPGAEDLPATKILKSEAHAFCRWAGKRLPTSAEWEKAARGTDGRRYPWGNEFFANRCNVRTDGNPACEQPLPGGSFPDGASPYGVHDLSGNVWEWVSDEWKDPGMFGLSRSGEGRGILRGGAHAYSPFQARASYQGFEGLEATCNDVGFRCARDAKPVE